MHPPLPSRTVRLLLVLLRVASLVVPSHKRLTWQRQWQAEVVHRWQHRPTHGLAARVYLFGPLFGAMSHALYFVRTGFDIHTLLLGFKHTLRSLTRRRAFAAIAALTLAVGIGSATVIYSIADAILLQPLPFEDSDRVVSIYGFDVVQNFGFSNVSYPNFEDWRAESDIFETVAAFRTMDLDLSGESQPERIEIAQVDDGFFQVLRTRPVIGRIFTADDHDPSANRVAVLTEAIWRRRFGADSSILGRTVRLTGIPHTVIGVVDQTGQWPFEADAWIAVRFESGPPTVRSDHSWRTVARLQPDISIGEANTRVSAIARRNAQAMEDEREQTHDAAVTSLLEVENRDSRVIFTLLLGAVGFVLVLACINVSNLLLTQGAMRSREFAIRAAIGATRARIVGGTLRESLVLALIGGGLGVLLATFGLDLLLELAPVGQPSLDAVVINPRVLGAALTIAVVASVVAGAIPSIYASRVQMTGALKEGGTSTGGSGIPARRTRNVLVGLQIVLSLVLLAGAGVMIRSLQTLVAVDPGFETESVQAFHVALPSARYQTSQLITGYYDGIQRRLGAIPGVEAVSVASTLPFGGGGFKLFRSFLPDGEPEPPVGQDHGALWFEVDPQFLSVLGFPATSGRMFTDRDDSGAPPVITVNETMARRLSPEGDVLGMRIRSWYDENIYREIVGIFPDLAYTGLFRQGQAMVFVPRAQSARRAMGVLVKTAGDPGDVLPAVRSVMQGLDRDVALDRVATIQESMDAQLAGPRFITVILGFFGLVALMLSATGVYGLTAFAVAHRTQEIGIRMALGARAGTVRRLVLRQSGLVLAVGGAVGLLGSVGIARLLGSAFFVVTWTDPMIYIGGALVLGSAALIATYIPARRATKIDPLTALRYE